MRVPPFMGRAAVCLALLLSSTAAFAEAARDRFSAGGYMRLNARPDFQGGFSRLGFWNLYGRLLNESSYANLDLKLNVLQADRQGEPWSAVFARAEAGSIPNADAGNGTFLNARLSQIAVQAGNILLDRVTWQLGTVNDWNFPDLHLYDIRPSSVLEQMLGLSAFYRGDRFDLLVGVGDSGWRVRGPQYNTLFTVGGLATYRVVPKHFEIAAGGQMIYEPRVTGNRFAPYNTPGLTYENYYRREVVQEYLQENPGLEDLFPDPTPTDSRSYRVVGYIGFGGFGPLQWAKILGRYERLHPLNFYTETVNGRPFDIYIQNLTDERYAFDVGFESVFKLWPERLDMMWAGWVGGNRNRDNEIAAGEDNRNYYSTVVRLQAYLTRTVHYLTESSIALEKSLNGNLFREHYNSVFRSTNGDSDPRGLELGDSDTRKTWQLKTGFVLNPTGPGVWSRPSIRILYGLQRSNQQAGWGNGFSESLSQFNDFPGRERHWHSVLSLEAEAWF